jgi:hypothetical protein
MADKVPEDGVLEEGVPEEGDATGVATEPQPVMRSMSPAARIVSPANRQN